MYVTELDWNRFFALAVLRRGFDFRLYRSHQLKRRIISFMELKNLHSLPELWTYLNTNDSNYVDFLSKLSINISEFFRDSQKWDELRDNILPGILSRFTQIKAWSAGCSYGAEVYSLAILLDAMGKGSFCILGTDISHTVLAQAEEGIFSSDDLQFVPSNFKDVYFTRLGERWKVRPKVKKNINFAIKDVFAEHYKEEFNLVVCRNLAIYLTREAQHKLYRILFDALQPGGVLFIGSTERVLKSNEIGFEPLSPFFYQKPFQEEKLCKNVS